MFVEKFIENPRHIEIQVLGDKHGNVLYLGERECSIQRRNQKVVEEAPSPLLDAKTRKAMGEQAVALSKAVGYDSAGTVEFVAGQDRSFFFLEMNTRLQVEHPVTELVTGLDLVEQMIRVAAGEKLKIKQADVKLNGWAVETRVYAEDPFRNFLPSIGRLTRYRPPQERATDDGTVRNDTGVFEGAEISMHYDPMIAKLVTHAATREAAIDLQADALDAFVIDGVEHNIPFLAALMQHPRWREGRLSTGFIAEEYKGGFKARPPQGEDLDILASVAIAIDHLGNVRRRQITHQMGGPAGALCRTPRRRGGRRACGGAGGRHARASRQGDAGGCQGHPPHHASTSTPTGGPAAPCGAGTWASAAVAVQVRPVLNGYDLAYRGVRAIARVYTEREAALAALMPEKAAPDTSKLLLCPMPGLVKAIHVAAGQEVKPGEALCVVEAMKMENILRAEREAVVKSVKAKPGDSLAVDAVIMEFA